MRSFVTFLLIVVFAAATAAALLLDGVTRIVADPDAVVATADSAGVHVALVDSAVELAQQEAAHDPALAGLSALQLHAIIDDVISKEWFDATLRRFHGDLSDAVAAGLVSGIIDLRPTKADLLRSVGELGRRADDTCTRLAGAARCAENNQARRVEEAYATRAQVNIATVPDQIALQSAEAAPGDADRVMSRRWFVSHAHQLLWFVLGALALLLLLIALINIVPLRRLLAATGLALVAAGALGYFLPILATGQVRSEIEQRIASAQLWRATDPTVQRIAPPVVARFTVALLDEGAESARHRALALAGGGVVLLLGAVIAGARAADSDS